MRCTAIPVIRITRPVASDQTFGFRYLDAVKGLLSIDFDQHDDRLKQCLEAARAKIENSTGLLLVVSAVTVGWQALYDWEPLPWGPVVGDVTALSLLDTSVTARISTEDFPVLSGDYPKGIKLAYQAGYNEDTLPADLLEAVLNLAANNFDAGDREWRYMVFAYRRGSFIS